jgi:hypothetical protein
VSRTRCISFHTALSLTIKVGVLLAALTVISLHVLHPSSRVQRSHLELAHPRTVKPVDEVLVITAVPEDIVIVRVPLAVDRIPRPILRPTVHLTRTVAFGVVEAVFVAAVLDGNPVLHTESIPGRSRIGRQTELNLRHASCSPQEIQENQRSSLPRRTRRATAA